MFDIKAGTAHKMTKVHVTATDSSSYAEQRTDGTTDRPTREQTDGRDSRCIARDGTPVVSRSPRAPDIHTLPTYLIFGMVTSESSLADLILHDPGEFGLHYFFHH